MRSWFVAASLVFALALAAMSGTAGATDAAATAAEKDARFFLAVCQNALDDLAAVSRLAAEQNWESMVDPRFPESKPEWIDGMWRVNRDDRRGAPRKASSTAASRSANREPVAMISSSSSPSPCGLQRLMTRAPPTCALRGIESRIFRVKDRHCKSSCFAVA